MKERVFSLTRTLIDIPSVTGDEEQIGYFLRDYVTRLTTDYGAGKDTWCELMEVAPARFNVFARFGTPIVTLSTHIDTVPPFVESREDEEFIWGRGACDTKGIIASMLIAAEELLASGAWEFGLLFVVGEERDSIGARNASTNPRGSRFIINGEPTDNKLALGTKGALRIELIARGRAAHSGYPDLGESAIEKLLDALGVIRQIELPVDPILGHSTLNIGTIEGGRSSGVIADEARAVIFIRLVGDSGPTHDSIRKAVGQSAEVIAYPELPAIRLKVMDELPTTIVAYATDIPAFAGAWGQPLLLGPGTIHVAHTLQERVPKKQLIEAVDIYQGMVRRLKMQSGD